MNHIPIEYIGAAPQKKRRRSSLGGWLLLGIALVTGWMFITPFFENAKASEASDSNVSEAISALTQRDDLGSKIAAEALRRTLSKIQHDSAYYHIDFPMGDIPADRGKDVDVVIRSYRALGTDLQQLIHEDISSNFRNYPQLYDNKEPDKNIDHRRVPNLQRFFTRSGEDLPVSKNRADYAFGDLVVWRLVDGSPHIGIVVPGPGTRQDEKWVVHNIGNGPEWADSLLDFSTIGHYRYLPGK